MKGLFTLHDLSTKSIFDIIALARKFKGGYKRSYPDKKMATLFFENSTRTHYSFQVAMMNLGIQVLDFNAGGSSVLKGESLYDTIKTFEAFGIDGIVVRDQTDEYFRQMTSVKIPIFNGGDGKSNHPTQSLLDLMTIYEEYGHFEGLHVCIIGDVSHSRVAHSNIEVMERLGMKVSVSGPAEFYDHSANYIPMEEAIKTCDVIMLLRVQFERHKEKMSMTVEEYHQKYGITMDYVKKMKENAIIMHPAPFNRGVEIEDEVIECPKSRIFKQMTNGVYIRMAVISAVLDGEL